MLQMIEANWLIFIAALLIGIVVAWWLFARGSKPARRAYKPDVLDEGAAPAQRNQALIDTPPAAQVPSPPVHIDPPAMAGTMAGIGEIIAVAAQEGVDAAEAAHDVEAPPAPVAVPAPAAPSSSGDDLSKLKGVGPKLVALLSSLGVTSFAQIAAWTDADIDVMDAKLGAFAGRIRRDNWVEQARLLTTGDTSAYEAKFGKM